MQASSIGPDGSFIGHNEFVPATAADSRSAVQPARPGVIAGAVLRAARHNTGLTRRNLARLLAVPRTTVKRWEHGTSPLYAVDYFTLQRLATATGAELSDLLIGQQCDLLIAGLLSGTEDFADVPPIDEDSPAAETARELLRWALTGRSPTHRHPQAQGHPLLADAHVTRITNVARELAAGTCGQDLASYGTALLKCTYSNWHH